MNKSRNIVVISRHWDKTEIDVRVESDSIALSISLEDFCRALASEINHPLYTLSRSGLVNSMLAALEVTLNKVKESSVHQP